MKILSEHNNSIIETLQSVYPHHEWYEWKFHRVPIGFWEDSNNRLRFTDWLGKKLGYKSLDDWYNITTESILSNGGGGMLTGYFNNSPIQMLQTLYPKHEWIEWKFITSVSHGYWENKDNQLKFMKWLGTQLQYQEMEDWYNITIALIHKHGGRGLLSGHFNNSPILMLQTFYPTYHWIPWKFSQVPNGYWESSNNQLKFLEWMGEQLEFKSMEDWYNITQELIYKHGGRGLLSSYFNNSPIQMIQTLYPEHKWIEWKFAQVPIKFWENPHNQKKFLEWLGKELGYTNMEDWYGITQEEIHKHGGRGLLSSYFHNSPMNMLQTVYSSYEWLPWRFKKKSKFYDVTKEERKFMDKEFL